MKSLKVFLVYVVAYATQASVGVFEFNIAPAPWVLVINIFEHTFYGRTTCGCNSNSLSVGQQSHSHVLDNIFIYRGDVLASQKMSLFDVHAIWWTNRGSGERSTICVTQSIILGVNMLEWALICAPCTSDEFVQPFSRIVFARARVYPTRKCQECVSPRHT